MIIEFFKKLLGLITIKFYSASEFYTITIKKGTKIKIVVGK